MAAATTSRTHSTNAYAASLKGPFKIWASASADRPAELDSEREREKERRWKQKLDSASRKKSKKDPHLGRSYLLFLLSSTFNTSTSVAPPPQNDVDIQMGNSDPGPSTQPSSSTLKVC